MTQPIDPRLLRTALGQFATGVAIVTAQDEAGKPVGLTVNSFASVSLDPPLVLWSLGLASANLAAFRACSHFAVNILSAEQVELSNRFAMTGQDKFAGLAWSAGLGGAPLFERCCARFECRNTAQHAGGDHLIFIGQVERLDHAALPPLIFQGGGYCARADLPAAPLVAKVKAPMW